MRPEKSKSDKELHTVIQSVNSGRELEAVEKIHKNELKKYHNHEGEQKCQS
jgi:hypothetical protein